MKYAVIIIRVLLGLLFAVFGSNAFLHFIPMPPMQGLPGQFIGALFGSGYFTPSPAFKWSAVCSCSSGASFRSGSPCSSR